MDCLVRQRAGITARFGRQFNCRQKVYLVSSASTLTINVSTLSAAFAVTSQQPAVGKCNPEA